MIGAALALTSCSNDEQVAVNPGNEITFRPIVTRATQTTTIDNAKGFMVTAYFINDLTQAALHIKEDQFTSKDEGVSFTGTVPHRWDVEDQTMVGQAWAAYDNDNAVKGVTLNQETTAEAVYPIKFTYTFAVEEEIQNQVDFISANVKATKDENAERGIQLNFAHNLSQIEIFAKKTATNYNIKIKQVKLGNIKGGSAEFTQEYTSAGWKKTGEKEGSWDLTQEEKTISSTYTITCEGNLSTTGLTEETSLMPSGQVWMLLPQELTKWESGLFKDGTASYIALLVDIDHVEGGTGLYPEFTDEEDSGGYAWIYVPLTTTSYTWEAGKHYKYILNFTDDAAGYTHAGIPVIGSEEVKFINVSVSPWGTSTDEAITANGDTDSGE